jgi:NTE family protein
MTNLFPKSNEVLPKNMAESWHRARDLLYTDKIDQSMKTCQIDSRHLTLLKKLHHIANDADLDDNLKRQLRELEPEYQKLVSKKGAIVKEIIKIERRENSQYIFGDADFSKNTINS